MSLQTALNFAKLASAYVAEGKSEKAMSAACMMLDHMERASITPDDFDSIEITPVQDILPNKELSAANKNISTLIKQATLSS